MDLKIAAVVPTVHYELLAELLKCIEAGTRKPDMLFIIDNSKEGVLTVPYTGAVEIIRGQNPLTVNESWNIGRQLASDYDVVSFLNDDILVGDMFFQNIETAFSKIYSLGGDGGVVCPATTKNISVWARRSQPNTTPGVYDKMRAREGWAFSISREALDACPLIPIASMRTFCGDDWIWHFTRKAGFDWYKDLDNLIYHAVGKTVKTEKVRQTLKAERRELNRLIGES